VGTVWFGWRVHRPPCVFERNAAASTATAPPCVQATVAHALAGLLARL
jgi:hypothetical protein